MTRSHDVNTPRPTEEALRSLVEVGTHLADKADRRKVLDLILLEARRLAGAEAGSLYLLKDGRLRFVSAQNDKVPLTQITEVFLDHEMPASADSLAGYAASSGQAINIADAYALAADAPYHFNRDFDTSTGYRTQSILATPLWGPDDEIVGVLQLFNRLDGRGEVTAFPSADDSVIQSLASMAALAIHNILLQERLKQAHLDTILRLSVAVEFRDSCTYDHIRRMAGTSALVARAMGLSDLEVELIRAASPMHDIGKIGIPDAVLQKPGPLTPEERAVMERHPEIGAEILGRSTNDLLAAAREVALTHHERWNGQGYPGRLAGEAIPISGRIVGLADVFDALASKRIYKAAFPLSKVLEIICGERGKHFDPRVVDAMMATLDDVSKVYGLQGD
ncbi:MAG: HD domain-containing protein [Planctomycetota bacterium]|nr:HD domain-containing protein [Planctomycetota bacterium]